MKSFFFTPLASLLLLASNLQANDRFFPAENIQALAGVNAVDAQVVVSALPATAEASKRLILQAFEVGIMREGVEIDEIAPNYLQCQVVLFESQFTDGWYYTATLRFFDFAGLEGLHTLLYERKLMARTPAAAPWKKIGEDCAELFSYAWLRANLRSNTAN